MKKFFEDRKQKFIKDIYNRNPDVMEKLKEVFGRVLDDMLEAGYPPGAGNNFGTGFPRHYRTAGAASMQIQTL